MKLNKVYDNKTPKADVTLLFDELAFGLDDEQYRDMLLLVDLFHSNLKKQQVNCYYYFLRKKRKEYYICKENIYI